MRALVVDDDLIGRLLLTKMVARYGHVDVAVDGAEAVQAFIMALDAREPYDVIFLDIVMPVLDGHGALARIRATEESRGIFGHSQVTVIMITALDDSRNVIGSFREGAEGYIVKPVSPEAVTSQLRQCGLLGPADGETA
ncbi:MAG: response regulator [Nitrospinae bacterium]|nr:response regulator [Nitrospinota bacterium]